MEIRMIRESELDEALDLVLKVFMEFEAPDYSPEGVDSFVKDIIHNESFREGCKSGTFRTYAAFKDGNVIGVLTLRKESHIMLFFVQKEYQKQGVGRALFEHVQKELCRDNNSFSSITVNSSPDGVEFYKRLGFVPNSGEQEKHGIRYVPMSYTAVVVHKEPKEKYEGQRNL